MALHILLLVLGIALLILGAEWLVNGAAALAKRYRMSDLAIGLTVVAFGTSAPELAVNVVAAGQGQADLVFGNVVGSNIVNLFLILGITGLIMPLAVASSTVWREIPFSLAAIAVLALLVNNILGAGNVLGRWDGMILLAGFALFVWYVFRQLSRDPSAVESVAGDQHSSLKIAGLIVFGLVSLVGGGKLLVTHAVAMAQALGMPEKIIAMTVVAIGTSLPEMATSVVAALKRNASIAVGNIVGSNVFNIFLVLGASALIKPVAYNPSFNIDLVVLSAGTFLLFVAMFTGKRHRLDRWEAALLLLVYLGYTGLAVAKAA